MRRWQRECWAEQKRGTLSLATAAAISDSSANEQSRPSELSKARRYTFGWDGVWHVLQMQLKECFQNVAVRNTAGTTKGAVGGLQPLPPLLRYFMQSPWSVYSTGQIKKIIWNTNSMLAVDVAHKLTANSFPDQTTATWAGPGIFFFPALICDRTTPLVIRSSCTFLVNCVICRN